MKILLRKLFVLILLTVMLLGCSSNIYTKRDTYPAYGKNKLYAHLDKNSDSYYIKKISNISGNVLLNDYTPTFDTQTYDCGAYCYNTKYSWNTSQCPGESDETFRKIRVDKSGTALQSAKTLGLSNVFSMGGMNIKESYFDAEEYNKAIKSIEKNNHNKYFIDEYDQLMENVKKVQETYAISKENLDATTHKIFVKYNNIYKDKCQKLKFKLRVKDESGFYDNSIETDNLASIEKNKLDLKHNDALDFNVTFESSLDDFSNTLANINNNLQQQVTSFTSRVANDITSYETLMSAMSSYVTVKYNNPGKRNNYTTDLSGPTEFNVAHDRYEIPVTLRILSKDFHEAYPKTRMEDKNVALFFNGRTIDLKNKTQNYIQIKSISMYYNNRISTLSLDESESIELPPDAIKKKVLPFISKELSKEAEYLNMTVAHAKKTNISFGFALKYRIVEQSIDKTLYNTNSYNLYDVLRDI